MTISFNNIPSGVRVPLFYAEVDNSMANTAVTGLKTLLIGRMTQGKATPMRPVLVTGDSQGKDLFGRGSELARMNTAKTTRSVKSGRFRWKIRRWAPLPPAR